MFVLIGLAALVAFEAAFAVLRGGLTARLDAGCRRLLTDAVLARALRAPVPLFEAAPVGDAGRRIGRIETIASFLSEALPRITMDAGVSLLLVPVLLWFDAPLAALVLAIASGAVGLILFLSGPQRRAAAALRVAVNNADLALAETAMHRVSIQALGLAARQRRRWDVLVARATRGRLADAAAAGTLDLVAASAETAIRYAPVILGVALAIGARRPGLLADLFAFTLAAWRFAVPLRDLGPSLRAWAAAREAMRDVAAWANAPGLPEADPRAATVALAGHVAFADVAFTYPDAPGPTLRAVTFTAEAGTTIGVVGRPGAGKSTLARLLGRQIAGAEGLIKIDGIDIRAIPADRLRRAVAVVRDDAAWFAGTLGDNLAALDPAADATTIRDLLRLTGAAAAVDALPDGLATRIEEGAMPLADGERQRLAIARALLGGPAVLVLDDAMAALDAAAEARLLNDLRARGRLTIVAITQRLTTLAQADAVLVLDGGEIQDIGRHHDLILRSDLYNGLWQRREGRLSRSAVAEALPSPDAKAA